MNLLEGATTIQRNTQIGGHRAGGALPEQGVIGDEGLGNRD